jgi:hypothetical protein
MDNLGIFHSLLVNLAASAMPGLNTHHASLAVANRRIIADKVVQTIHCLYQAVEVEHHRLPSQSSQ